MKLSYPAPTLSIGIDALSKIVADTLRKKRWHRFKEGTVKLVYLPVYVFLYQIVLKEDDIVVSETTGKTAIDGVYGNMLEYIPAVLDEMPMELKSEVEHGLKYEVKDFSIDEDSAKNIVKNKLSSLLKVPSSSVAVYSGEKLYWPFWIVWVEVREGTFKLTVDGVTGTVSGAERVPERELGWYEITTQVLNELRTPKGWIKYLSLLADQLGLPRWLIFILIPGLLLLLVWIIITG